MNLTLKKSEVEYADTPWKRFAGLMMRKRVARPLIFILPKKTRFAASVHSFFMRTDFDIAWLDGNRIVDVREHVQPWRLNVTPSKPCTVFIELPSGFIKQKSLKISDKIVVK